MRVVALGCPHGPALLKAFPAKNRAALGRPEGNGSFLSTLRAVGLGLRAHLGAAASSATALRTLGFAALAPLWFVFEALVGEKHLLASSKNKLGATLRTLQDPIVVFHEPLSPRPEWGREWVQIEPRAWMLRDTENRGSRARIPRACWHESARKTQTSLPNRGLNLGSAAPSRGTSGD